MNNKQIEKGIDISTLRPIQRKNRIKDYTGQRFGRLVALECVGTNKYGAVWKCKCDCNNIILV